MKIKFLFTAFFLSVFFLSGCENNGKEALQDATVQAPQSIDLLNITESADSVSFQAGAPEERQKRGEEKHKSPPPNAPSNWDKKIIKTAQLTAEVKDFSIFSENLTEKVAGFGGYISGEQQNNSEYKIETSVTIKVPADQFDKAVAELSKNTISINEKQISSQDVTGEFVDARSRLEAKKLVRLRYLELLNGAKKMEDILAVQSEINSIQEEIEMVSGRINYLGYSSAMSTINFSFYQILNIAAKDTGSESFLTKFSNAFSTGWFWLGSFFVGIVSIWPLLMLVTLGFILFKKRQLIKAK